jgi:hypothetical protein
MAMTRVTEVKIKCLTRSIECLQEDLAACAGDLAKSQDDGFKALCLTNQYNSILRELATAQEKLKALL